MLYEESASTQIKDSTFEKSHIHIVRSIRFHTMNNRLISIVSTIKYIEIGDITKKNNQRIYDASHKCR